MTNILGSVLVLTQKEQLVAMITSGIAAFSMYLAQQGQDDKKELLQVLQSSSSSKNSGDTATMFDFILKNMPQDLKKEVTVELIDEVFDFVSKVHYNR